MKKIVILLLLFLLVSCSKQEIGEFVLMADGSIENYLIIVDSETCVTIKYDNREIDKDKLLEILGLTPNLEFKISVDVEQSIIEECERYRNGERSLTEVFIANKNQLEPEIEKILFESMNLDIKEFTDKLNKQSVYYFDDIEEIKDSANNLALWLKQVKSLSTRKDL